MILFAGSLTVGGRLNRSTTSESYDVLGGAEPRTCCDADSIPTLLKRILRAYTT